jgi:aldose 1-epimerase
VTRPARRGIERRLFGTRGDDRVELFTIRNGRLELDVITLGGIVTALRAPDRYGVRGDVVLGHSTLAGYVPNPPYLGAIVGRFANRIARARFTLDGALHRLAANDGPNHLHGGVEGFDQRIWSATPIDSDDRVGVELQRTSPAGEEHYPGALTLSVTYLVDPDDTVEVHYAASTDAATVVNITQHTYFNLGGPASASVLDHVLTIDADHFTPVDAALLPTGEILPVRGTPFDFTGRARIGDRLAADDPQLRLAGGFDHNFVLRPRRAHPTRAAELRHDGSGRVLTIATTEPGIQLYTGHLLDGSRVDAHGRLLARYGGLCLETQHYPDSPNQPHFPSVTLRPGDKLSSSTNWTFRTA